MVEPWRARSLHLELQSLELVLAVLLFRKVCNGPSELDLRSGVFCIFPPEFREDITCFPKPLKRVKALSLSERAFSFFEPEDCITRSRRAASN